MDDIVRQAIAKWPNVPHCTGWLLLDRRGAWRLRDDAAQAAGELGSPVRHDALNAFIARNYACDAHGQWFFQNGPQRVYVELAYTPWVVRLVERDGQLELVDHTGAPFEPEAAWLDDAGGVLFRAAGAAGAAGAANAPPRVAVLHDHDLGLFADHADFDATPPVLRWRDGRTLPLGSIARADVPATFGFVASPAQRARDTPAAAAADPGGGEG
ncbi:DUF2946 family protein [Burkholderia vietnamiensis]|uniref:DUF2946 family protein n=1 Tax=Burkholderia vietnamiensis TaxID=60552 RepID=UPI000752E9C5|nr:DUF2946 family protein [Burkholderia vietnamiensis]KVF80989.1 hypothetical protein WJ19_01120 [Burkholderia vietnamiensis]KVF83277.1 hypothetical protein WJ18_04795 [Burkholderia vietnamiensis]KVF84526.1 hypothetical protein WJ20_28240 [Burkholderia vietnamiensis]KVG04899.1 hypothetical protein WJ22_04185 [Burkholderia vietnamiensis]MCA8286546.1 DUF2946 family protein [Burkholderia vietnamiensis]